VFSMCISYLATTVKGLQRKKNSLYQSPMDSCGPCSFILVLWYYQVSRYESLSLIHLLHRTTLRCIIFLFYVRCQDICLHGYGVATVHRQCKVLFIYPLINLSSKKTMQKQI